MVPILTEGFPGLLRHGRSGVPSYLRTIGMSRLRCLGVLASLLFAKKKSQDFASFFQMNIWSKVMNESDKTWFVYAVFKE